MSGGSMNYLYRKLLWECDFVEDTPLRKAFSEHLIKVAAALKAVEWVDSGDWVNGDEDGPILEVLGSAQHDELLKALKDCADAVEHWGAYAPDYFKTKHDLEADIKAARDTIAKAEGKV